MRDEEGEVPIQNLYKEVTKRMNKALNWIKYNWMWMFCGIFAFMVGVITYFLPLAAGEAPLYLLSALSQGLAAIFTLIFAITIFAAQMMRKFTAMDKMMDKWTIVLMLIFAIGIILPLIHLKTDKNLLGLSFASTANLSLSIDLAIATFCVLSIIPYLKKVNRIMKYDGGIAKLKEEASEAIDLGHRETVSNKIHDLVELGESAVNDFHIERELRTNEIIGELWKFGIVVAKKEWTNQTRAVLDGLPKIGEITVKKRLDRPTARVLEAFNRIGIITVQNELQQGYVVNSAIEYMRAIGLKAIDNNLRESIERYPECLISIGVKVTNENLAFFGHPSGLILEIQEDLIRIGNKLKQDKYKDKYEKELKSSMAFLWVLGAYVQENFSQEHTETMVLPFKNRENEDLRKLFEGEFNNAKGYLGRYNRINKNSLEDFKRKYDYILESQAT